MFDLVVMFQSAPAIAGGRCGVVHVHGIGPAGFNPRPPWLAGDASGESCASQRTQVSIRARHCWRAMPAPFQVSQSTPRFQSAPAIAGGRCLARAAEAYGVEMFQSAPAIAGGRCRQPERGRNSGPSFNPRPPLLAGDAQRRAATRPPAGVSIRARHCWRAMLASPRNAHRAA